MCSGTSGDHGQHRTTSFFRTGNYDRVSFYRLVDEVKGIHLRQQRYAIIAIMSSPAGASCPPAVPIPAAGTQPEPATASRRPTPPSSMIDRAPLAQRYPNLAGTDSSTNIAEYAYRLLLLAFLPSPSVSFRRGRTTSWNASFVPWTGRPSTNFAQPETRFRFCRFAWRLASPRRIP